MGETAPGHRASHSEPPPCYNCGMRGHIFTACPEPTRATPAGLEASRARQQVGGSRGDSDHPNKRHKGPIVTRYSQPPTYNAVPAQYPPTPPVQHFPYALPQHYPPAPTQYPYQGQHGHNYPPPQPPAPPPSGYGLPPQLYGAPPYGQHPYHLPGRSGGLHAPQMIPAPPPLPIPGHPPHYNQPPGFPPQPPYGYHGPPPGSHAPPVGPPPAHHQPDYRPYPGLPLPPPLPPPPPPAYSGYSPHNTPFRRDSHGIEHYQPREDRHHDGFDDRRSRSNWSDRRHDGGVSHPRERSGSSRGHAREERWPGRGRQDSGGSFDRRRNQRPHAERSGNNHDRFRSRSRPRSDRSVGSQSQKQTPVHVAPPLAARTPVPDVNGASEPEATPQTSKVEGFVVLVKDGVPVEGQTSPAKQDTKETSAVEVNDTEHSLVRMEDENQTEEEFLDELKVAFADSAPRNQGDAIAEPLPGEYSEQIMLPPAFDAKGVKSKYITPSHLDDFALSVRDTNQWNKYRNHPVFLAPEEVNLHNLGLYMRKSQKGQGHRNDKRGRGVHGQHHDRDHHRSNKHDRGDQRRSSNVQRKRKWDDRTQESRVSEHRDLGNHSRPYAYEEPSRVPRQMSPEPGEISDTSVSAAVDPRAWPPSAPPQEDEIPWTSGNPIIHPEYPGQPPVQDDVHTYNRNYRHHVEPDISRRYNEYSHSPGRWEHPPRSRSPYYRGRQGQSRSPPPAELPEKPDHHKLREPSQGPLLDELQSHIDKLCSTTLSKDIRHNAAEYERHLTESPHQPLSQSPATLTSNLRSRIFRPESPTSYHEPTSRRSSLGNLSPSSDAGSPLTRIEAELLGLVGADEVESESKSPKREHENHTPSFKRKQRKVNSVYE
ncbi:zinc knuckle like protein [Seiridium cupressi]